MRILLTFSVLCMLTACDPSKREIQKYEEYKEYCTAHKGILAMQSYRSARGYEYKQFTCTIDNIEFKL